MDDTDAFPGLSNPAKRALAEAGYTEPRGLDGVSAAELLRLHGMGPKGIRILRGLLAERGFSLGD